MAYNPPIPERKQPAGGDAGLASRGSGAVNSLVHAQKLMQIAFVLPCAMVFGWGLGWCVDHFLHTGWATVVGLVFGLIAGMATVIRMAMDAMNALSGTKGSRKGK